MEQSLSRNATTSQAGEAVQVRDPEDLEVLMHKTYVVYRHAILG